MREQFHKLAPDFFARAPALRAAQNSAANTGASEGHLGGQQQAPELNNREVIITFDSTPPGAVVLVDGAVLCQATPCSKTLQLGGHSVSIQKRCG